jgi:hypothetical protein
MSTVPFTFCEPDYPKNPHRMDEPGAERNSRVCLPRPPQHVLVDPRERELAGWSLLRLVLMSVLRLGMLPR